MGKIVISENVTLDGVVEDPTGEEGFRHGGWFLRLGDKDRAAWAELELTEARTTEALLLGRRSDEWFAARWPARRGAWADRLNGLPKYVVSTTARAPEWSNATGCEGKVLNGDPVEEIPALREELDGDIVVYASIRLAQTLLEHGLVDELRLTVFPFVLGAGRRLFDGTSLSAPLRLVSTRTVGDDLALLTYRPAHGSRRRRS
ncbi:dihydrofolate reductase family protein [Streptomyces capillispiralis]|uniref:dihydrofolate reductase family protein n=1 Tax=Streptomyces capillispiralis TaxID=68182 RepID=UPI0036C4AA39